MKDIYLVGASNIVPKARPRFGSGRAFTPKKYRASQEALSNILAAMEYSFIEENGYTKYPFQFPLFVTLTYTQKKGDADNIGGAMLDALVKSGMIKDDSRLYVPTVNLQWVESLETIYPGAKWVLELGPARSEKDRLECLGARLGGANQL